MIFTIRSLIVPTGTGAVAPAGAGAGDWAAAAAPAARSNTASRKAFPMPGIIRAHPHVSFAVLPVAGGDAGQHRSARIALHVPGGGVDARAHAVRLRRARRGARPAAPRLRVDRGADDPAPEALQP